MLDSDIMNQSPLVLKLWLWFLMKANWKDRDQLKRGEFVTTIAEMQEAMSHFAGWRKITPTRDQIRSAYEGLAYTTRITTRKTTRGMIISIINYSTYQNTLSYVSHTETLNESRACPSATPHDTESLNQENQDIKPSSPPKPKRPVSSEACRLSEKLAGMILNNFPNNRTVSNESRDGSIQNWAADIDRLIRIDGQSPEEVEQVIEWCQSDSFWKANILSGSTLRKQWDTLTAKMANACNKSSYPKQQGDSTFEGVVM
jgi:hypothetical protein